VTEAHPGRISVAIAIGAVAWAAPSAAALTVLVPAKLAEIAPNDKVHLLAVVTIAGSVAALLAAIGFGMVSDLTRSRFGARSPWIVIGGVLASCALLTLSVTDNFALLLLAWLAFQISLNAIISPLKAMLADRVPVARLGRTSSIYGAATLVGFATGAVIGAQFLDRPNVGLRCFAAIVLVLPLVSVVVARELANLTDQRVRIDASTMLLALRPPRHVPDFYWALAGRFGVMLGSSMITTFQLYILTDYAELSLAEAGRIVGIGAVVTLGSSIVGSLISGVLSDRIMRRKVPVVVASVIIATAMVFPLLVPEAWAMLVFAALSGLGMGVYYSVDIALMTEVLPNRHWRSRDLGILNISNAGGQSLAPGISSLVIAAGLGFAPVFAVAMAVTFIGGLSTLMIRAVK